MLNIQIKISKRRREQFPQNKLPVLEQEEDPFRTAAGVQADHLIISLEQKPQEHLHLYQPVSQNYWQETSSPEDLS